MTVKISTKGQIVIPLEFRKRLGLVPGDALEFTLEEGKLILHGKKRRSPRRLKVKIDRATGFPYFDVPKDAPPLTAEWVREQLADFP